LTDVDETAGAHSCIEGTHLSKNLLRLINPFLTDEQALRKYGERVKTLTGKAGIGFFEEQTAFHKRGVCKKPRLALLLNYNLHRKPE